MRKYKLFAFYAPKDFEVNVFDKTFDFSIIEDKEEVVIIYDELYTNYNVCRFDLLAIQKLLKGGVMDISCAIFEWFVRIGHFVCWSRRSVLQGV